MVEVREYLIRKAGYYYRPNRAGYTTSKFEAGRYTKAEAESEAAVEPWRMEAIHQDDVEDDPVSSRVRMDGEKIAALKKQVEELTAERDALEVKAVSLLWAVPGETLCGEVQSLHKRALELQSAEAEAAALREALKEIRKLSGLDNALSEGASATVMSRMADIHQHSDAALASTRETSDAG